MFQNFNHYKAMSKARQDLVLVCLILVIHNQFFQLISFTFPIAFCVVE